MSQSYATQAATKLCSEDTVKDTGLNFWASGEHNGNGPEVDIIAVQGLGAHPYHTWVWKQDSAGARPTKRRWFKSRGHQENPQADALPNDAQAASERAEVMWLRDFLPDLIPNARIATYSYESDWRKKNIKTSLRKCGEQLLNVLHQNRPTEKEARRPLIFIGHSLGGLIIKQALVLADHGNKFRNIQLSTAGIIFLGAPHQGSGAAVYGVWLAQIAGLEKTLLESLEQHSPDLHNLGRDFEESYGDADIVCFYEDKDASYGSLRTQFVDHQSASLHGKRSMYLTTDHSGLNKFCGPQDENFMFVRPEIQRMIQTAPRKIEERYNSYTVPTQTAQRPQDRRDDQELALLETLASNYRSDKDLVSTRVPGTCEWFFEDDRFLEWRDSNISGLLWVSAGPGCGKSVLARALVDEKRVGTNAKASTVCYFFFKDGQQQRTHGTNALSALLHQLFENTTLITHALPSFSRYGKKLRDEFSELWEILVKSAEDSMAGEIICILDALDECEESARRQLEEKLYHFFSSSRRASCHNSSLKLKFLITSRPYDGLEQMFQRFSNFSTYVRLDGDEKSRQICQEINLVIDAKVPHITGGFNNEDRKRISSRLKEMENRTYLWLFLTIDIIEKSPSRFRRKSDIDSLLSNLPLEISDAYEKILGRSEDEDKARILLELIVTATRTLTLEEANMALAIATQGESCRSQRALELWPLQSFTITVQNMCGLFVSIHDGKLFLIHQTAKEFLIKTSKSSSGHTSRWKGCLDMAAAHGTMSRICLDYLNFEDVASDNQSELDEDSYIEPNSKSCFLDYAAKNWFTHYTSQPAELAKNAIGAAQRLCTIPFPQGNWFKIYCTSRYLDTTGWTDLGIASLLGLPHVAERFLNERAEINALTGEFGDALQVASTEGHQEVVRMLLDKGADVNAQGYDHYGNGNALQGASVNGHDKIVRMLLDKGADVNAQGGIFDNALYAASLKGHDKIVRMLLDKGADVNAQGGVVKILGSQPCFSYDSSACRLYH